MMELLWLLVLITHYLWVSSVSFQSFDAERMFKKKKNTENEEAGSMQLCVHVIICLNIHILSCESLSVVGQKINMTQAEVFPESQVLYDSAG